MKDSEGNLVTAKRRNKENDELTTSKKLLNRPPSPPSATRPEIPPAATGKRRIIGEHRPSDKTRGQVLDVIKLLKSGKATGPNGIPLEALKQKTQQQQRTC
ncbi:unnamed protein product [Heterobilharzia americana]|nr:unnamed protein product [Heterobilharzia americana]